MKIGLFLPLLGDPAGLRTALIESARTADRLGFHALWFPEHVVLVDNPVSRYPYAEDGRFPIDAAQGGVIEPFVAIAMAAGVTEKIRLGTGICLLPQRSPVYTAKQVADCDVLSGGRVDFGVGIGWLREEFEALGEDFEGRAYRCREYLDAMQALWTDDVSRFEGRVYNLPPVRMLPKPLQKPSPPIIFGGDTDAALRRVADLGQGWFGFNHTPGEAAERIQALSGILSRRGRNRREIEVIVSPYLKPVDGPETVAAYAAAGVDQLVLVVAAVGATDSVRAIEGFVPLLEAAAALPVVENRRSAG